MNCGKFKVRGLTSDRQIAYNRGRIKGTQNNKKENTMTNQTDYQEMQHLDAPDAWAEVYRGSGRPTGHRSTSPTRCQNGDVAPDWVYVGDKTEDEFWQWVDDNAL